MPNKVPVNLSISDIQKLARLAKLELSDEQAGQLEPSLSSIVTWVGSLNQAPTADVLPMAHPHDVALRLRADEPQPLPTREALLANAPEQAEGLFLVPRVVE
ncbi:MAG: Asp-tRNA(Asn)/Glu-tRNA(Gln) amidotransferase subunit GatC [Burkholderiaceae bacterium]